MFHAVRVSCKHTNIGGGSALRVWFWNSKVRNLFDDQFEYLETRNYLTAESDSASKIKQEKKESLIISILVLVFLACTWNQTCETDWHHDYMPISIPKQLVELETDEDFLLAN